MGMKSILSSLIILSLSTLVTSLGMATEIDPFTKRAEPLADSYDFINEKMSEILEDTVKKANEIDAKSGESCKDSRLLHILYKKIGNRPWGKFENMIESSSDLEKHKLKREDSIYQDFHWYEALALFMAKLGSTINVRDHYVGADKFGHFAAQGWIYFNEKYKKGEGLEGALKWGEDAEAGLIGLKTTGIFSYGDLVANYNGLLFFERVLNNLGDKREELVRGKRPYISCLNGKWVREAEVPFDWMEYIDVGWDEAYNCSKYRSSSLTERAQERIKLLGYQCPLDASLCHEAFKKYPLAIAQKIFHPLCHKENTLTANESGRPLRAPSAHAASNTCRE